MMPEKRKRGAKELVKRYIVFVISLFITALGVAFTRRAGLGVPPNSSISNVLSLKITTIDIGTFLIIYNFCVYYCPAEDPVSIDEGVIQSYMSGEYINNDNIH